MEPASPKPVGGVDLVILERLPVAVVVVDGATQDPIFLNTRFTELFGYALSDVDTAGKWWLSAYPDPTYRQRVQDAWMAAVAEAERTGSQIELQTWRLVCKDGSERTCEFEMVPLGKVSVIAMNDITERLAFEKEQSRAYEELEERVSERTAQLAELNAELELDLARRKEVEADLRIAHEILDEIPAAILLTDLQGTIREWRGKAESIFGYTAKEAVGRPVNFVHRPEIRDRMTAEIIESISNTGSFSGEIPCVRKDGTSIDIETTAQTFFDSQGAPVALIGVNRDITEQKRLAVQVQQAQRMEAVGRLAGGIAHDLNNVLMAANMSCDLLARSLDGESPMGLHCQELRDSLDRGADMIRRLLEFSRREVRPPRAVSVREILSQMRALLDRVLGRGMDLRTIYTDDPCWVHGDPSELEQVILNLVVNARDAMSVGGTITVQVRCVRRDDSSLVELAVSDKGPGIPDDVRERMFEPFFTTSKDGESSGLGLSIVYNIVRQRGGFIEVMVDQGTSIRVLFPQIDPPDMQQVLRPEMQVLPDDSKATVLLCEDNDNLRRAIARALELSGFRVLESAGVDGALAIYNDTDNDIDVILTDVVMPHRTGVDLAEEILDGDRSARIIFMTGYADSELLTRSPAIRDIPVVQKPVPLADLVRLLSND